MKTVLVAGGAGFIGSNLCERLLKEGEKVICVDNLITSSERNIMALTENALFNFVKADVTQPLQLNGKIDQIYHLASPASPPDYQRLQIETLLVNSLGTLSLLNLAIQKNARFLFTSTSEVYGDPLEHPQKETYWGNVNPIGIRSCYDEAKRFGEALVMAFVRQKGVDARIVRIFNTYGPNMRSDDGRVVSNFINQAIRNESITVYGSGKQTRSFCFVSDMVDGLVKAMDSEEVRGEVINLGNPQERAVVEFAETIKSLTHSRSEIVFHPLPKDDPEKRKPDISKARAFLDWEPKVDFEEGMRKTIEYYRQLMLSEA
ncbi:SDR family oxidoreductase [Candidatus Micrarchaeota archaeon]|nr:SDR family oxidoreductase [Candidatus Micrarchaeota archaeon]